MSGGGQQQGGGGIILSVVAAPATKTTITTTEQQTAVSALNAAGNSGLASIVDTLTGGAQQPSGGILLSEFGNPSVNTGITKSQGQALCDALTSVGATALAAQIQPIVTAAT